MARNQRERLAAAIVGVCAEKGYAGASVAEVAKRAGVSSVTFYKQFADKRGCMLAAHRQLLGRLLEAVDGADAPLRTLLSIFAADLPSARLLTVEILATGPEGAKRHNAMVEALAARLGVEWVPAAGAVALIGCQRPSVSPQRRPSNLPADGHDFSPPVAIGSLRLSPSVAVA